MVVDLTEDQVREIRDYALAYEKAEGKLPRDKAELLSWLEGRVGKLRDLAPFRFNVRNGLVYLDTGHAMATGLELFAWCPGNPHEST